MNKILLLRFSLPLIVVSLFVNVAWGYSGSAALISYRRSDATATYLYQARCSLALPDGKCSLTTITVPNGTNKSNCSVGIETEFTDTRAEGNGVEWLVKVVKGSLLQTYLFGKSGLKITEALLKTPTEITKKIEASFVEGDGNFIDVPQGDCKKMSYFVRYL